MKVNVMEGKRVIDTEWVSGIDSGRGITEIQSHFYICFISIRYYPESLKKSTHNRKYNQFEFDQNT